LPVGHCGPAAPRSEPARRYSASVATRKADRSATSATVVVEAVTNQGDTLVSPVVDAR
jgi:hypothetical protein